MAGFYSLVLPTLLTLGLGALAQRPCDLARQSAECGVFLPTTSACGLRPLTPLQMQTIEASQAIVREIEAINGPVYEFSAEAARLGISRENPIVDLSFEQQEQYRRCEEYNLLTNTTMTEEGVNPQPQRRRKRQASINSCCAPAPNAVRILASVTPNGNAVQVLQPPGLSQFFQDVQNCPQSPQCGTIQCAAVETVVPADVILLNPLGIGRQNIVVNICGGASLPP